MSESIFMVRVYGPLGWHNVGPLGLSKAAADAFMRARSAWSVTERKCDEGSVDALYKAPLAAARAFNAWCRGLDSDLLRERVGEILGDIERLRKEYKLTEEEATILAAEEYVRHTTASMVGPWDSSTRMSKQIMLTRLMADRVAWNLPKDGRKPYLRSM